MTACVNKKHTRRVALAISASLVGALSLGAATPVFAAEGDGISTLAEDGQPTANATVDYKGGELVEEFTYNGLPQGPVPTKVHPYNEDSERVAGILPKTDRVEGEYYYYYVDINATTGKYNAPAGVSYVDDKGETVALTGKQVRDASDNLITPTTQGEYAVVVCKYVGGNLQYVSVADTFEIVGQALDDAVLVDGQDVTDTEFAYTGETGSTQVSAILDRINVALDGRILDKDSSDGSVDYTMTLWDKGAKKEITSGQIGVGTTYILKIEGKGAYEGQAIEREFTLNKLDLSEAVVVGNVFAVYNHEGQPTNTTTPDTAVASINGIEDIDWGGLIYDVNNPSSPSNKISLVFGTDPDGSQTSGGSKGAYTYTLEAAADNPNVTGEATVVVTYANYEANVDYVGDAKLQADDSYLVDLSDLDANPAFDVDDIEVTRDSGSGEVEIPSEGYGIKILDDQGNEVGDMSVPGTYYVRVDVDYTFSNNAGEYLVAGSKVFKVVVRYNLTKADNIFFSYKDENYEQGASDTYDGSDFMDRISIKVKDGDKEFAEGTDYTVKIEKRQSDGKFVEVDSIVDAGYYEITVEGQTFTSTDGTSFYFIVDPITITGKQAHLVSSLKKNGQPVLAWTGAALTASYTYTVDGEEVAIPADAYEVEYVTDVDGDGHDETAELKDVAVYKAYLSTAEGVVNYDIDARVRVEVTDAKAFADVPTSGVWYAEPVYQAYTKGYMTGYNGTELFGPEQDITRGQVAVVLFKMAGGTLAVDDASGDQHQAFETPFTDVDPAQYYAQAIQWAQRLGIVTGYDGTTEFRPDASITREEFATMLARYAEAAGIPSSEVEYDLSALDAYADGSTVADFADEAVAWAVEAGVMGQDVSEIRPSDAITRAEVAAMAVRAQPDEDSVDDGLLDRA